MHDISGTPPRPPPPPQAASQTKGRPTATPLPRTWQSVRRHRLRRRCCRTRRRRYLAAQSTVMFIRAVTQPPMICSGWRPVGPLDPAIGPIPDAGDRDSRNCRCRRPPARPSGRLVRHFSCSPTTHGRGMPRVAYHRVDRAAPATR